MNYRLLLDYALTVDWGHNFARQWFSTASASYKWLADSAAANPLTLRINRPSANFVVGYRF